MNAGAAGSWSPSRLAVASARAGARARSRSSSRRPRTPARRRARSTSPTPPRPPSTCAGAAASQRFEDRLARRAAPAGRHRGTVARGARPTMDRLHATFARDAPDGVRGVRGDAASPATASPSLGFSAAVGGRRLGRTGADLLRQNAKRELDFGDCGRTAFGLRGRWYLSDHEFTPFVDTGSPLMTSHPRSSSPFQRNASRRLGARQQPRRGSRPRARDPLLPRQHRIRLRIHLLHGDQPERRQEDSQPGARHRPRPRASAPTETASDSRWDMRSSGGWWSRAWPSLLAAFAATATRGGQRAHAGARAPAPPRRAPRAGHLRAGGPSGAAAPNAPPPPPRARPTQNGGQVQQRIDTEIPVHHRRSSDADTAPPVRPQKPVTSISGTPSGLARVQPDPPPPPPKPASPTQVEELIRRSTDSIDFFELVDDILDEIARQLALEDPNSDVADGDPPRAPVVQPAPGVRAHAGGAADRAPHQLDGSEGQRLRRVRGAALAGRERQLDHHAGRGQAGGSAAAWARRAGIKTFMDLDFTFSPDQNIIWMEAKVFRASDGGGGLERRLPLGRDDGDAPPHGAAHPDPRRALRRARAEDLPHAPPTATPPRWG